MLRIILFTLLVVLTACRKSDSENAVSQSSPTLSELASMKTDSNLPAPKNADETFKQSPIYALALEGQPQSMLIVGQVYLQGMEGLERNPEHAEYWVKRAATSGKSSEAESALGHIYMTEKGFINYDAAYEWLAKSATSENVRGQFYLGNLYEKGLGVQSDLVIACAWYGSALFSSEQLKDTTYSNIYSSIDEKYKNCFKLLSSEEIIELFAMYKKHKRGELFSRIPNVINSDNDSTIDTTTLESDIN